ncbi:MAG: Flp pilus assembly protein CpaB, partial [Desulfitobacteriaceae bacterium]
NTGSSTALTIPEGKRAVAIPIGLVSGVGYAVKPGDHVDVLVTLDLKDPAGTRTITSLAAQDILVLSVGESISGDKSKPDAKSYTLALSVPQAMAVTLGSEKGSLRLLLRNPANSEQLTDSPIDQSVFLSPDYHNIYK